MLSWLSRATLDIIGLAGFNYSFDALKLGEESNELGYAFAQIFNSAKKASVFSILQARISILQWIVRPSSLLLYYCCRFPLTRLFFSVRARRIDNRPAIQDDQQSTKDNETNWPPARA